jgi:hypothetical protein
MKFKIILHSVALHAQIYPMTNSSLESGMRQTGRSCADFVEKSAKARVLAALESLEEHTADLLTVPEL